MRQLKVLVLVLACELSQLWNGFLLTYSLSFGQSCTTAEARGADGHLVHDAGTFNLVVVRYGVFSFDFTDGLTEKESARPSEAVREVDRRPCIAQPRSAQLFTLKVLDMTTALDSNAMHTVSFAFSSFVVDY